MELRLVALWSAGVTSKNSNSPTSVDAQALERRNLGYSERQYMCMPNMYSTRCFADLCVLRPHLLPHPLSYPPPPHSDGSG